MLRAATLASGSSGNCAVVSDGQTCLLIDAGISARRIVTGLRGLGIPPEHVHGVLITHEHSDHIAGLAVLCRQLDLLLYSTEPTACQICARWPALADRFRVFDPGDAFSAGGLAAYSFPTNHDCVCPVGYALSDGAARLAFCTDLGIVTEEVRSGIRGAGLLVGEFNHDIELLRSGPYPPALKRRILGESGHLSNEAGAGLALWAAEHGARQVVLAHLSAENNRPELAVAAAERTLRQAGAEPGRDVGLTLAPRSDCSGWMEVPTCSV